MSRRCHNRIFESNVIFVVIMVNLAVCVAEGDTEDTAQLSQLQMLYRARGRQLEDLRSEMDALTQESAKERRRLKHLLSVVTG